jgi:hypothetical protein
MSIGRGDYQSAIRYIVDNTDGNIVTIGSDHDFGRSMILEFYKQFLPIQKELVYYKIGEWPESGPDWVLIQSQEKVYAPLKHFKDMNGRAYTLKSNYGFEGTSGWHWSIYKNDGSVHNSRK